MLARAPVGLAIRINDTAGFFRRALRGGFRRAGFFLGAALRVCRFFDFFIR
jgi:hypothetical protein